VIHNAAWFSSPFLFWILIGLRTDAEVPLPLLLLVFGRSIEGVYDTGIIDNIT
jgi:hypothetical protein